MLSETGSFRNFAVSNRIFETLLYNLFLSDADFKDNVFGRNGDLGRSIFIHDGVLDVPLIMDHFIKQPYFLFSTIKIHSVTSDSVYAELITS